MKVVPFSKANHDLEAVLDGIINNADTTVITRRDSKDVVVMSLSHFDSLMETVHLLRSPANAKHLSRSIEQYKSTK